MKLEPKKETEVPAHFRASYYNHHTMYRHMLQMHVPDAVSRDSATRKLSDHSAKNSTQILAATQITG